MILTHGTTSNLIPAIIASAKADADKRSVIGGSPWICSDNDGYFYAWSEEELIRFGHIDTSDWEDEEADLDDLPEAQRTESLARTIKQAFESADIAAAYSMTDCHKVVLVFDVPAEIIGDESGGWEYDESYDGSDQNGAMCFNGAPPLEYLIGVVLIPFSAWRAPFVLAGFMDNQHFNSGELPVDFEKALEQIKNVDTSGLWETHSDIDYSVSQTAAEFMASSDPRSGDWRQDPDYPYWRTPRNIPREQRTKAALIQWLENATLPDSLPSWAAYGMHTGW